MGWYLWQDQMVKAAPASKSLKIDPMGKAKTGRKSAVKVLTSKDDLTMAGQLLRDIQAGSRELTERSERLLRRVS